MMNLPRERMTFDLRQRYRMTSDLIEAVRDRRPLRILDAGSREGFLRRYLPEDRVINLDRELFPGDSFLVGDLMDLPFPSETFDLTVSLDVLEHIEPGRRLDFLEEMARVSRDHLIVGAPFYDERVVEAERLANDFYLKTAGRDNEFLAEHRRFGLPRLEEITSWIEGRNYRTVILPNNYLPLWLVMMGLSAYLTGLPTRTGDLMATVTDLYELNFSRYDYHYPSYRRILLIAKSGRLDERAILPRFTAPPFSRDFQERSWGFAREVLTNLADHLEGSLPELHQANRQMERRIAELQERNIQLEVRIHRMFDSLMKEKSAHAAARAELNGIKNTLAYRLFKRTWGRLRRQRR